ncbi:hypothetical protein [Butyrivibrio sp. YAB3001]|uniref:hypothetical protein n=1 Tax=Butyrivibrio sp. YAB3001 TaxID=1520812 RepID=UPI0008F62674|nr:hypothetical protein [Butyrivibrio sp. YAB3001]SFC61576.1 hypothetical protein SAMN02910398_02707 [Butyrivibrio sp. YAB3001]
MGKQETKQLNMMITGVVVLFLVCLFMYGFQYIFGISIFPDEFGYWACAARVAGYDWSETASIGSYYSFGYSLILAPILRIFSDSIMAYRAALVINLMLQILSFFLIKKIMRMLFEDADEFLTSFLSGICVLYPSWSFYVQTTMSEALLFFMYTLTVYLMLRFLEKPGIINGVLVTLSAIYLYTVHMRTIGTLAAVFLVMLAETVKRIVLANKNSNDKSIFVFVMTVLLLILLFVVSIYVKNHFIDTLFSNGAVSRVSVNDYSGQTRKLEILFSLSGLGKFFKSMIGKIFYLGCATFGFAYLGVYSLFKRLFNKDNKAAFVLLSSLAQFMVMCIYLIGSAGKKSNRFDLFLHGRYFDFAIPLLMAIGIYELLQTEKILKKCIIPAIIYLLSSVSSLYIVSINETGMNNPHSTLAIAISYFLDKYNFRPYYIILMSTLLTLAVGAGIVFLVKLFKIGKPQIILVLIYIVLVIQSFHALNHFIYLYQAYAFGDVQVADAISDFRKEGRDGDVILLYTGEIEFIDNIQLRLKDEHIHVEYAKELIKEDEATIKKTVAELPDDALVLLFYESGLNDYLADRYDGKWLSGHFIIYYQK